MISKKKVSIGSQQTEADSPKRFFRKTSNCSLSCRSASWKKLAPVHRQKPASVEKYNDSTTKMQTESQKFYKNPEQGLLFTVKRCSQSLKLNVHKQQQNNQHLQSSKKSSKLQQSSQELQFLRNQCKRLKFYLDEQRQKRKLIQQQMRLSRIEIKRIQRRLEKYRHEKEMLQNENQQLLKHVQRLQSQTFNLQAKQVYSYRLKIMQEQAFRLRQLLKKHRTLREQELMHQIDQFAQQKYNLTKQINTGILANTALAKQMEEMEQQLKEIRVVSRQKVVRSLEFIDLRERYKALLLENRQLKCELQHMLKLNHSQSRIDLTLLTVSNNSLFAQ